MTLSEEEELLFDLAADIAKATNCTHEEARTALHSCMIGEYEPLHFYELVPRRRRKLWWWRLLARFGRGPL